ncbi:MAG: RNA polymerase sigma factor RpoH [Alphaproteobacteria bacterium]|jgi:RNA polymerase sigma-32 factor|tara:strand:+ start:68054 stop:68911 length:858 start_codon:yes stop_codon:yes gene_type:complete
MYASIPIINTDTSLNLYLKEIKKFPMLSKEEEYEFANLLKNNNDTRAAHKLVTSHLRLVAKIANGYKGYGLPLSDVIAEGNIGLMQAVRKFEPEKGFRLATYAMWWVKASIQEYVLKSWSLVKIGTTASQKKLFFNLRKIKSRIAAFEEGDLKPKQVSYIAENLGVSENDVVSMNRRIIGDSSLNVNISHDGGSEWQDFLEDDKENQESVLIKNNELLHRKTLLHEAMNNLNDRERDIFIARRVNDETSTLEQLSQQYNISRERVRQIESRAFEKVKDIIAVSNV